MENNNSNHISGNGNQVNQSIIHGSQSLPSLTNEGLRDEENQAREVLHNQRRSRFTKAALFLMIALVLLSIAAISAYSYYVSRGQIRIVDMVENLTPGFIGWVATTLLGLASGAGSVGLIQNPGRAEKESKTLIADIENLYIRRGLSKAEIRKLRQNNQ